MSLKQFPLTCTAEPIILSLVSNFAFAVVSRTLVKTIVRAFVCSVLTFVDIYEEFECISLASNEVLCLHLRVCTRIVWWITYPWNCGHELYICVVLLLSFQYMFQRPPNLPKEQCSSKIIKEFSHPVFLGKD